MPTRLSLTPHNALSVLVTHVLDMLGHADGRVVVGIAGGPGAGKSTLAREAMTMLNATHPGTAVVVPMDGFHIAHARLEADGLVEAKGAPHTFEGAAFVDFLARLRDGEGEARAPGYDRATEDVTPDAIAIPAQTRVLIVEGNYLLLPDPPWAGVKPLLDFAVHLDLERELARRRLLARHAEHGRFTEERNRVHVETVDLVNFDLVSEAQNRADLVVTLKTDQ